MPFPPFCFSSASLSCTAFHLIHSEVCLRLSHVVPLALQWVTNGRIGQGTGWPLHESLLLIAVCGQLLFKRKPGITLLYGLRLWFQIPCAPSHVILFQPFLRSECVLLSVSWKGCSAYMPVTGVVWHCCCQCSFLSSSPLLCVLLGNKFSFQVGEFGIRIGLIFSFCISPRTKKIKLTC